MASNVHVPPVTSCVISLSSVIESEVYRALTAIGGVAVYYLFVWLFRNKLSNEFVFYIR